MSIKRQIAVLCARSLAPFHCGVITNSTTEGLACSSTDDLSRIVSDGRIDALVIDQRLPGFLTGLEILAKLSKDLVRPVSVLIGDLSPDERQRVAALKLSAVLPVDTPEESIATAVAGSLARRFMPDS